MIDTQRLSEWIHSVQGQYIDMDGAYGAQCWDLAAHWSKYLGMPVISTGGKGRWAGWAGNMVDAFPQSAAIATAYELIGPDAPGEPGDIPIWGDGYYYYPKTHVAVLVSDKGAQLLCMSQNSSASLAGNPYPEWTTGPTILQHLPRRGLIGFIRPKVGIAPQGTITPASEEDEMTPQQMQEIKDFVFSTMGTMLTQYHDVTRSNVIGELSKKIENSAYEVKVFTHSVDNSNADRVINDNRAQHQTP